jgi:hypothetical protein
MDPLLYTTTPPPLLNSAGDAYSPTYKVPDTASGGSGEFHPSFSQLGQVRGKEFPNTCPLFFPYFPNLGGSVEREQVAPSRKGLKIRGPTQILDMYLHGLDRHKGNGNLSLLYLELNVNYEQIKHLLIKLKQLREL